MKFASLDSAVKKQIKASMKRIAQKFINLNTEKANKLEYKIAFNIWTNRYISTLHGNKYYNFIQLDEVLFNELQLIMEGIFLKEINIFSDKTESKDITYSNYFVEKPATKKQINYAKYLMDTVKNEALPNKKYTMHEINLLINDLKRHVKIV